MIDLSFSKLLLLAVIALIVLGPEKLPKAARMAGAMLRRVQLGWKSVRSEVERELEMEEIRRAAKESAGRAESVRDSINEVARATRESVNETIEDAAKAAAAVRAESSAGAHDGHA